MFFFKTMGVNFSLAFAGKFLLGQILCESMRLETVKIRSIEKLKKNRVPSTSLRTSNVLTGV